MALLLDVGASEGASDSREVVQASEILAAIERGEPVEYDGVIVEGDLDLSGRALETVHFNDTIFRGSVNFEGTNFTENAWFIGANFSGNADFFGADFSGMAYFEAAKFSGGNAFFRKAVFSGVAAFFYAKFSGGGAYFSEVEFSGGNANFLGAEFSGGNANFREVEFSGGDAYFRMAKFSGGDAYFSGAEFSGGNADFRMAKFSGGYADFREVEFSGGYANFREAVFSGGYANFREAVFSGGGANFRGAEFSGGGANFYGAEFSGGDADFTYAECSGGNADFSYAEFNKHAIFEDAKFRSIDQNESFNVSLNYAHFNRDAYFENATFYPKTNLDLTRSSYRRMFLPWDCINQNQASPSDDDAYLALIRNYMNLGWYEDANYCYYEFRDKCRKNEPLGIEKVTDTIEYALYGYGVKPFRTLGWIVCLVFAFGLVFRNGGSIKKYIREKSEVHIEDGQAPGDKSGAVELKTTLMKGEIDLIDPFLFSLTTFTSGLTSFLYPAIEYEAEKHTRLVIVERLLGSVFLALLITAISKTYLIR